eukprot:g20558.t1
MIFNIDLGYLSNPETNINKASFYLPPTRPRPSPVSNLEQTFSKITYLHDISYGIVREIRGTAGGGDGDDAGLRSEYEAAGVEVSDSAKVLQDLREEFYTERGGGRRNEL